MRLFHVEKRMFKKTNPSNFSLDSLNSRQYHIYVGHMTVNCQQCSHFGEMDG